MSDPYPVGPADPSPAEIDVSVVVPVYNAMPYLRTLIRSLVAQDLDRRRYEVLVIDDGSTDDGPAVLDELAARHPQLTVVHQANSGWPGLPRNRGLDLARGRYVFFADADDEMGPESLRRMVQFADEHGSDVLLPKMVGVGGRWVRRMYEQTQVDADLETAFTTLSPQKLFRRSFLLEEGIRFPEEKVRLEDGMFLARAYLRARRVSLLGGYDFYRLVTRDDGQNISSQPLDPVGYTWSVGEVSRLILENDPDPERAARIVLDLYRRKCLKFYEPVRFLRMPEARRRAFLEAHADHIERFIPSTLEETLAEPFRSRSRLVRAQDERGLVALAREQLDQPLASAAVSAVRWRRGLGGLRLTIEVHGARGPGGLRPLELHVVRRGGNVVARVRPTARRILRERDGRPTVSVLDVVVDDRTLRAHTGAVLDLTLAVPDSKERSRVAVPLVSVLPQPRRGMRPYATVHDNLSIEVLAP